MGRFYDGLRAARWRAERFLGLLAARGSGCALKTSRVSCLLITLRLVFRADSLVLPEIAEPLGRKFAISNRMLDVLAAEIVLQRPSIHTLIGQLEPS